MRRLFLLLTAGALILSLSACAPDQAPGSGSRPGSGSDVAGQQPDDPSGGQTVPQGLPFTLYVGMDGSFAEYPQVYDGQPDEVGLVPPAAILAALSELTGWNLDLADEVTQGKSGMTVTFASTCAIFAGPPEEQTEEFHVYDAEQLVVTILDSIVHTFQNYYVNVEAGGDPSSLGVYFCAAGGQSIDLPNLGVTIPIDQPYQDRDSLVRR